MALAGITRASQLLRIYQLPKSPFSFLTENSVKNALYPSSFQIPFTNRYCTDEKPKIPHKSAAPHATEETKKRKGITSPQITLIDTDDNVMKTSLETAEKLAKRRNLKLVKIVDFDTKSERPVFKLMTTVQFLEEDANSKERKRNEKQSALKDYKMFTISTKIADNDLSIKVKQMSRALTKRHPVRLFIMHDGNPPRADEIQKIIEDELAEFYSTKESSKKHTATKLVFKPKVETENVDVSTKETKNIKKSDKVKVEAT